MFRAAIRATRYELGLKLVSILAAICLWLYVMNTEDPFRTETYQAPVTVVAVPEGLEVVKTRPETVSARIRGRLSTLERGAVGSIRAVVDLSSGKPGQNTVKLNVTGVPDRVTLEGVARPSVNVWLDHQVAEQFDVVPAVIGSPSEGCELLSEPAIEPAKVKASGSAGAIEAISQVVVRIDISGMSEKQTVNREVQALDDRRTPVSGVRLVPPKVSVELPIFQVTTKVVPVRARIGAPPTGFVVADVRPSPDTVTLKGPPEALRDVREVKTEWQSIRDLHTTQAYRVPLVLPSGLWPLDDVRAVSVRVTVRPIRDKQPVQGNDEHDQAGASADNSATDASIVTPDGPAGKVGEPDQGDTAGAAPSTSQPSEKTPPAATPHPGGD